MYRLVFLGITFFVLTSSPVIAQQGPTPVFVTQVQNVQFIDEIEALGTLQANENIVLTSTVTELITAVNFQDNQRVKKGDLLVEMDTAQEEAEIAEEQSRIDESQKQVDRLRPLVENRAASKSILDEQERELLTAKARIKAIQSRVNERKVVAPFDGVVGIRNISVGALVQPGTQITTLDDDTFMKLDFSVPEIFLSSLEPGINIQAFARAYPDTVFKGTVQSIDSRIDPVTRSVPVRAMIQNADRKLKAGMLMRVVLKKNPRKTLIIPEEALTVRGDSHFVMRAVQDGQSTKAELQKVEIGSRRQGDVEILSGLDEGDLIVNHGALRLRPGAEITIKAKDNNDETLTELLNQSTDQETE